MVAVPVDRPLQLHGAEIGVGGVRRFIFQFQENSVFGRISMNAGRSAIEKFVSHFHA